MAGAQERVLRRRIGSVGNTKKITRAMELISATRVTKAQQRAREARPYATEITKVIQDLSAQGTSVDHPLLRQNEDPKVVGVVVLASDRGLAGAYNASVIRAAEREVQAARSEGREYRLVCIGKKSSSYFRFRGYTIDAEFEGISDTPVYSNAREVAGKVAAMFLSEGVERIMLAYTEFVSLGTQKPRVRRFLPLQPSEAIAAVGDAQARAGFEFEPDAAGVLEALLPRYVESRLFSALLDAAASEHASRQRAMKSATDNAEDMILRLTRKMNQVRQDAITTEISEIISGAEALNDDQDDEGDVAHHLAAQHLSFEHVAHEHFNHPTHR
ncbi:MAG: F0F1 ATP synthase subunit gamma [Candidatus Microthrix sp.]|nr:F0F1 ATP synthase subunit gamma [Candidatus Microthrix sp.]